MLQSLTWWPVLASLSGRMLPFWMRHSDRSARRRWPRSGRHLMKSVSRAHSIFHRMTARSLGEHFIQAFTLNAAKFRGISSAHDVTRSINVMEALLDIRKWDKTVKHCSFYQHLLQEHCFFNGYTLSNNNLIHDLNQCWVAIALQYDRPLLSFVTVLSAQ